MHADENARRAPTPPGAVPAQTRRRVPPPPGDRIVRQVQAIDAWNVARRRRERLLEAATCPSHDERADSARQIEVLLRTHDAIAARSAQLLAAAVGPLRVPGPTAVIAHGHAWFADKLAGLLEAQGVTVLGCTGNGAEALGATVADQPDVVLVGERLAMLSGSDLLRETRLYARRTLRAVQVADEQRADAVQGAADLVFLRHHPPADVADTLAALLTGRLAEHRIA
jgi:hypothetical protein